MLIQQGYGTIVVFFDVWGIAGTGYGSLAKARALAATESSGTTDGEATAIANGAPKDEVKVEANGVPNGQKAVRV